MCYYGEEAMREKWREERAHTQKTLMQCNWQALVIYHNEGQGEVDGKFSGSFSKVEKTRTW